MSPLRFKFSTLVAFLCTGALVIASPSRAQDPAPDYPPPDQARSAPPPAYLAIVDGSVTLDREGQAQTPSVNMPIVDGDRLETTSGRTEVLFPDGSALDVDEYSTVELESPMLLRVERGRVLLTVAGANDPARAVRYQIDTPSASATTELPGEYRVAALAAPSGDETELFVRRGSGVLATDRASVPVRAGERSVARNGDTPSYPESFNSARFDAFDQWAAMRRDERVGAQSAQYLPNDLRMYSGTFDRNGSWDYDQQYGYVWYPNVDPTWRPYYNGYWSPYAGYGWTWIGLDAWAWPTHHFGRWGFFRSRWFWIPGAAWGPAWVSWGAAPGYVSWCPLGWDNRPVFALSIGFGFGHGWGRGGWDHDGWGRGWTFMSRGDFGHRGYYANRYAVDPGRLPRNASFVTAHAAPVPLPRGAAGGVRSASIAGPGRTFGPRNTAPSAAGRTAPDAATRTAPYSGARTAPYAATRSAPYAATRTAPSVAPRSAPYAGTRTAPYASARAPYGSTAAPYASPRAPYTPSRAPYASSRAPYATSRAPSVAPAAPYSSTRAPYVGGQAPYVAPRAPYAAPRTSAPYAAPRAQAPYVAPRAYSPPASAAPRGYQPAPRTYESAPRSYQPAPRYEAAPRMAMPRGNAPSSYGGGRGSYGGGGHSASSGGQASSGGGRGSSGGGRSNGGHGGGGHRR